MFHGDCVAQKADGLDIFQGRVGDHERPQALPRELEDDQAVGRNRHRAEESRLAVRHRLHGPRVQIEAEHVGRSRLVGRAEKMPAIGRENEIGRGRSPLFPEHLPGNLSLHELVQRQSHQPGLAADVDHRADQPLAVRGNIDVEEIPPEIEQDDLLPAVVGRRETHESHETAVVLDPPQRMVGPVEGQISRA